MDSDELIPEGMIDIKDAVASLHLISTMIGSHRHSGFNSILEGLRSIGFSDETAYYMICYVLCVTYQELESSTNDSMDLLEQACLPIDELFKLKEFEPFVEAVRNVYHIDDETPFGMMRPAWREHFKSRYNKYWKKYLNDHPASIPYYTGRG